MEDKLLKKVKRMPKPGSANPERDQQDTPDTDKRQPSRQYGTIGYLMEQLVLSDQKTGAEQQEARKAFDRLTDNLLNNTWPGYELPFSITRLNEAPHAIRQDKPADVKISYRIFTPPGHWGLHRYSILYCTVKQFDSGEPSRYMSHAGEELLYSEAPGLKYYFFNPQPEVRPTELIVDPRVIHRIRPEMPHNNFCAGPESLDCWMILRPLSGTYMTDAYFTLTEDTDDYDAVDEGEAEDPGPQKAKSSRLFVDRDDLKGYTTYAMLALGLRDRIRVARLVSGHSINQVAQMTALNPSYLGRLEDGTANISLGNLARLAHLLGIELATLKDQLRADPFFQSYQDVGNYPHWLHPHRWDLVDGQKIDLDLKADPPVGDSSSWIVVHGEVVFHYTSKKGDRPRKEILAQGDVVHLRTLAKDSHSISFTPVDDARLLEIRYSSLCSCGKGIHRVAKH
jgi:transcriptional regulator with XRE-family HTH domain